MKSVRTFLIVALLIAAGAVAQERETDAEPDRKIPAHTPEWTNPNESDPGATGDEADGAAETAGKHVSPSQQKVLVAPVAEQAEGEAKDSGHIRFGDGEHVRVPPEDSDPPERDK